MRVIPIEIPELGNRSYLIHDGENAVVIDPSRRIQQIIDTAEKEGVQIRAVFETHIHNDYITGGYALAQKLKIPYCISADEHATFTHEDIEPEESVAIGNITITAIATPGHTHHHMGYLASTPGIAPAFFSGGSVLYGAVGRTDLVSEEDTKPLAKAQYETAQHLLKRLHPSTKLFPTHGFGSFCAANQTEEISVSTFAHQLKTNPAYKAADAESFVEELINGLDVYPSYYAYMAPANARGPLLPDLGLPAQLTREALMSALHSGAGVIDLRSRTAYAAQHLPGTYNIEASNDLATYAGWLIAWDMPLILVAGTSEEVSAAQEQLSLIGRDIVEGHITPADLLADDTQISSYPVHTFKDLSALPVSYQPTILDVRRNSEWQKAHLKDAVHIPLHELQERIDDLKNDKSIWVYCASGFRASIAASMLATSGKNVALIDDSFSSALKLGLVPVLSQPFVDEIHANTAQLVDVRDDSEWNEGHAQGAVHMPVGRIMSGDVDSLDVNKPIYVYCETGERSGMAEDFLRSMGFNAVNIGGLDDWLQAGGTYE
jgi:hydroxyacylglutathione hydrolase